MGLFDFLRRSDQKANRAQQLEPVSVATWASPHYRDYESFLSAYKSPWINACVRVIAYNAANVEYKLLRTNPNGEDEEVESSPLLDLLAQPNQYQTRFELFEAIWTDLELTGNAFISLEGINRFGQPAEMYRLRPSRVTVLRDRDKGVAGYRYVVNGRPTEYAPEEMWHLRYPNPLDELYGMGTIEAGEARFDSDRAMAEHERQFWRNGAKITGLIQTDASVDDNTWNRLRNNISRFFRGSGYSTLLLENGLKYQSVSDGPAKLGMLEMARASRDQILAIFGVPPTKVGILENANYKATASDEYFWTETVEPRLTRLEQQIGRLVELFHPGENLRLAFDRLNFEDDLPTAEIAKLMAESYSRTVNELRQYQGLDPLEEGGDVIMAPVTVGPLDVAGALATVNEVRRRQGLPPLQTGDETILLPARATPLVVGPPLAGTSDQTKPPAVVADVGGPLKALPAVKAPASERAPGSAALVQRRAKRLVERAAQQHEPALRDFFASQQRRVTAKLRKALKAAGGKAAEPDWWNQADEDRRLGEKLQPLYDDATMAGLDVADDLLGLSFDLHNPRLAEFRGTLGARITGINETTRKAIDDQINDGLARGYSPAQIASGVADAGYKGIAGVFAEASSYRANLISRTESMHAYNGAALAGYAASGVVDHVEMLDGTSFDEVCAARNGRVVTLAEGHAEMAREHPAGTLALIPVVRAA